MNRLFISLVFVSITVIAGSPLHAEQVSASVLDQSGAVIPGVSVTLIDQITAQQWAGVSDDSGQVYFSHRRQGAYLVQADMPGFQSLVRRVELGPEDLEVDLVLRVDGLADEVLVTATGNPQLAARSSRSYGIIEGEQLESAREAYLGEALLTQPGLRIQRLGGPGSFTTIRFRGLRDSDTGLLFNGHRIRDAGGFRGDITGFMEEMMLTNISRIELTSAASSHLYGTSANAGVINLVPEFGKGRPSLKLAFEGGALHSFRKTVHSQGNLGRFRYSAGAVRTDVNSGLDGQDVYRNTSLSSLLELDLHPDIQISGMFYYTNTPRFDLNESPFPTGPPGQELDFETGDGPVTGFVSDLNDPDSQREASLLTGIFSWDHRPRNFWSYSVYYQSTDSHRDFVDGQLIDPLLSDLGVFEFPFESSLIEGTIDVLGTQHHVNMGPHHLVLFGVEHERESRTNAFTSRTLGINSGPITDRQSSTAFFVQDHISMLARRLALTASFRAQFFEVENPESIPELEGLDTPDAYTGGVSLSYWFPDEGTKLRAQAANGFRAPSLTERFAEFESIIGKIRTGNPLLRPERTLTLDFGIDQFLMDHHLRLGATYFYNRLQEIIVSSSLFQQENAKGGLSRGMELFAKAAPATGLDLNLSYTYTNADFVPASDLLTSDNTVAEAGVARAIEGIPTHHWSAGLNYRRQFWDFNLQYVGISGYTQGLFSPRFFREVLFPFEGYQRINASIGYTLPLSDESSVEFYLKGENLLNYEYFEDGFTTPGTMFRTGIQYRLR
jgi:outer membrane receptor protein involved in Fe transport